MNNISILSSHALLENFYPFIFIMLCESGENQQMNADLAAKFANKFNGFMYFVIKVLN
jgi:hypothetical protein